MNWKKFNRWLVLLILAGFLVWIQWPKQELKLVFCSVGQGDATLISYGHLQMLVDGGPDNTVLSCLGKNMPFWDRKIEVVAVTHPQADHMTGLIEVLKRYKVERFFMSKVDNPTPETDELKRVIESSKVSWGELDVLSMIRLGKTEIRVLFPFDKKEYLEHSVKDVNEVSTVLLGSYGDFDFLLTGDIGEAIEDQLRLTGKLREVEVLKVAHHGSKYSSGQKFLEAVKPKLAVIEVGKNRFGHPTEEVLERLSGVGAVVLRTDEQGDVRLESDGKKWVRK